MCGIAGLWAPRLTPEERSALVGAMLDRLRHRGPDGTALWDGDGVTLGITRLAIVSPHLPARVLTDRSGAIQAVVNGEVYNHSSLRADLALLDHEIAAGPDTAVIPHLYEEHGIEFPTHMDGMFAAAVWDRRRQRLVLARDRAGEKPLFVASEGEAFAFASEPRALISLPWVSRRPAPAALARYLTHGYLAGTDCAFAAIRQVAPAHVVEVVAGMERTTRYWRPWDALGANRERLDEMGDDALVEGTRAALVDAVASRLPDDVSFGVLLSGGIDSGLVAALAARRGGRVPTFTLRIAHRGYDESAYARLTAAHIGAEHHEAVMDPAAGERVLEHVSRSMDSPLGDPSILPTWGLAQVASRHVAVVLTGEGGDELFAGYPTYLGHRWAGAASRLPGPARGLIASLATRFRPRHHHVTVAHLIERFLAGCRLPAYRRHHAWFGAVGPGEALSLLAPDLRAAVEPHDVLAHLDAFEAARGGKEVPTLVDYQMMDLEHYLGAGLLAKVDRCTMAHGLESRAPFLRPALIEHSLALPDRVKLRGRSGKWVLKRLARGLVPERILQRRKQGFSPPFSAWARGPLRALVAGRLSADRLARVGVLDPTAVRSLLEAHLSGHADRGRALWTVLSLQLWAEAWINGASGAADSADSGTHEMPLIRSDRVGAGAER